MNTKAALWKRPLIWGLGKDAFALQLWICVMVAVILATATAWWINYNILWTGERVIHRLWPLPVGLAEDFTLVTGINAQIIARPVDPAKTRFSLEEESFWTKAATKSEHFVFPYRPPRRNERDVDLEIHYLVQNPGDTFELHSMDRVGPIPASWAGSYFPQANTKLEGRNLVIEYHFALSYLAWLLLGTLWLNITSGTIALYMLTVQPRHVKWTETSAHL